LSYYTYRRDFSPFNSVWHFFATYDKDVSNNCETVVMIGVGTSMAVRQYDQLATKISTGEPIITVLFDHNPGNMVKLSGEKYANLYNEFTKDLGTNVPVCEGKSPKLIAGGHSAGGLAALQAVMNGVTPDGFIGLDPFEILDTDKGGLRETPATTIDPKLPVLSWGFEKETCFVNLDKAGKKVYELSGGNNRVFFRANNGSNGNIRHCEFTDTGCTACRLEETSNVKDVVAKSIQVFAGSVRRGRVRASDFQFETKTNMIGIDVFVNSDPVKPASASSSEL